MLQVRTKAVTSGPHLDLGRRDGVHRSPDERIAASSEEP